MLPTILILLVVIRLPNKRQIGQAYEQMAEQYLCRHHLIPITRNFSCRSGEIDLIMQQGKCLVFIEVKYRTQSHYGSAVEAVNWQKQQKLKRAAFFGCTKMATLLSIVNFVLMSLPSKVTTTILSGLLTY